MSFTPTTHRGFFYALPPFPTPILAVLTSEQTVFPGSQLFNYEFPQRGWRSTSTAAQELGLDYGPGGIDGVLIERPNTPTITWKETDATFGPRGAGGPNVLLSSTLLRQTITSTGEPEAPWYATASGAAIVQAFASTGDNLPHEHWDSFTRVITAGTAVTIFQTVSFRSLVTSAQTGMRVWLRSSPTAAPNATVNLRIVSAAGTIQQVATARRSWDQVEVTGAIAHATNTTVSFQLQFNQTMQIDIANVQAWRGYDATPVGRPILDYTTNVAGYEVPIHPDSARRGLFLELPGTQYHVLGIPVSFGADDGALHYSIGALVGMPTWQPFPLPMDFALDVGANQNVNELEFPSLAKQTLVLSGKQLFWNFDLGQISAARTRAARMALDSLAPGRPFFFFENIPPATRALDEELISGPPLVLSTARPVGPPMQGHLVRRMKTVQRRYLGLAEVISTNLELEEVT